jgi:hypothetical protein
MPCLTQVAPFGEIVRRDLDEILDDLRRGSEALNGQGFSPEIIESVGTNLSSAIKKIGSLFSETQMRVQSLAEIVTDRLYGILDDLDSVRRVLDDLESEDSGTGSVDRRFVRCSRRDRRAT